MANDSLLKKNIFAQMNFSNNNHYAISNKNSIATRKLPFFLAPSRNKMKIGQGPLDVYTFFMVLNFKGNVTQMLSMIFSFFASKDRNVSELYN